MVLDALGHSKNARSSPFTYVATMCYYPTFIYNFLNADYQRNSREETIFVLLSFQL